MDISSLGTMYAADYLAAGNMINRDKDSPEGIANFADALKRTAAAQNPDSRLPTPHSPTIDKTDKLYEQCVELEIFLVKTLISTMRNTVQKSGLIDEGFAGKMYEDMLYDEYTRDFVKNANFGLAEMAYLELTGQRGKAVSPQ